MRITERLDPSLCPTLYREMVVDVNFFQAARLKEKNSTSTALLSVLVKRTTIRETVTSRHRDGVLFTYDSIIFLLKIHVKCINWLGLK